MKRKNDVSYHMTWETQDHDLTCSCKNAPIPMASVLHSHDGYEIYFCPERFASFLRMTTGL